MDSYDESCCERASDGQVKNDGEDKHNVHVKKRQMVEPEDADDESIDTASDGQVEGDDVHVREREKVQSADSDDNSCENASDGQGD